MRLLVVRHGQTDTNAEHRYLGALDVPLNAIGIQQAHAIAACLRTAAVDALYCSPMLRARQTAEIVSGALGLPAQTAPAFRERHVGVFEGLTQSEAQARFPDLWATNVTRQWRAAPDGGETISDVFTRVTQGLRSLFCQHQGDSVALIAHGFVAKVVRALVFGNTPDFFDWQLANGSVLDLNLPPDWEIHLPMTKPTP